MKRICVVCGKEFEVKKLKRGNYAKAKTCCKACTNKLREYTCLNKYGTRSISQVESIKKEKEQTHLKHYGVKTSFGRESVRKKARDTFNLKYNSDNFVTSNAFKQKCIEKFGVDNPAKAKEIREKVRMTTIKHYGVENVSYSSEIKEKRKQTALKHYGVDSYFKTYLHKDKYLDIQYTKAIMQKQLSTKKANNTIGNSKAEKIIEKKLNTYFKEVKTQYYCDKYPFRCDFYIPKIDLYIEYQGIWTHGGKPFEGTKEDLDQLLKWQEKAKSSMYYVTAIDNWTKRDPLKREIAKENNLNWIEFFTMEQFINWFDKIGVNDG